MIRVAVCNKENSYYDPEDENAPLLVDENSLKERKRLLNDYKQRLLKISSEVPGMRRERAAVPTMVDEKSNSLTPVKSFFAK